jgi:hypothetical protein
MMDSAQLRTKVGVADLLATYQYLADAGKIRQLAGLFTPDAVFENNTGEHIGPQGVLDFFQSTKAAFIAADFMPARHYLNSVYVQPRGDGSASAYACFQYIGIRGLDHWGTYRDEVIPAGDGWKFARRQAIVEGCVSGSPVVGLLGLVGRTGTP